MDAPYRRRACVAGDRDSAPLALPGAHILRRLTPGDAERTPQRRRVKSHLSKWRPRVIRRLPRSDAIGHVGFDVARNGPQPDRRVQPTVRRGHADAGSWPIDTATRKLHGRAGRRTGGWVEPEEAPPRPPGQLSANISLVIYRLRGADRRAPHARPLTNSTAHPQAEPTSPQSVHSCHTSHAHSHNILWCPTRCTHQILWFSG